MRKNDPEGLRRRVLDAAARLFQSAGYHATGMHEVMREAGVTGGALHHHFPTKKALGLAVIRERVAEAVAETWIAPVDAAPSGAAGVLGVFAAIAGELEANGRVQGCPLGNLALELSLADTDFATAVDDVFTSWRAALAARLGDEGLATFVVATYSGAMALAKAAQDPAPLRTCAARLARLLEVSAPAAS
jgi:AcrR family transcriptional regulator